MFLLQCISNIGRALWRVRKIVWGILVAVAIVAGLLGSSALTGINVPPVARAAVYQLYFPMFNNDYFGVDSTLYLLNSGSMDANISLNFSGNAGSFQKSLILQPGEQAAIQGANYPDLPAGSYRVIASSDQGLNGSTDLLRTSWDRLAAYRAIDNSSGLSAYVVSTNIMYFGPFIERDILNLWNTNPTAANLVVDYLDPTGSSTYVQNAVVPSGGMLSLSPGANLPAAFVGLAIVSSDQSLIGLLAQTSADNTRFELQNDLGFGKTSAILPRAFKHYDEGGGARTTLVFVANAGAAVGNVSLSFRSASGGTPVHTLSFSLAAGGSQVVDLSSQTALTDGVYAVSASSDQPVVMGELTDFDLTPTTVSAASLWGSSGTSPLFIPHQYRSSEGFSAFSVYNNSGSPVNLKATFYSTNPSTSVSRNLEPFGWARFNLSQMPELGASFTGTVGLETPGSSGDLSVYIDEYLVPPVMCQPPANLELTRQPAGDIYAGDTLTFTATLEGDQPFTYTWSLDGTPAGENLDTYTHTFTTAGDYNIGVNVTNDCGNTSASLPLQVLPVEVPAFSLATSFKRVNLTSVDSGDILTYTLFLRNTSSITASATLTDPIPLHTTYIPGSAQSSDGNPVTLANGELLWSGDIISGTPLVIDFGVQLTEAISIGASIDNAATLADGLGNRLVLTAQSTFNPGYGLSIDEGLLYTNVPTVTLGYSWNQADDITQVRFSNDGGFGPAGNTTDWMPVNPANPTLSNWVLSTLGDLRLPRLVYVKFRDATGVQYGPFQDDIIYDPLPPEILSVEILPANLTAALADGTDVIVRVTATDDNTGVGEVQLSSQPGFTSFESYPMTGAVTDIPWTIPPGTDVFVRVADRSGNLSSVVIEPGGGGYNLLLPLLVKLPAGG